MEKNKKIYGTINKPINNATIKSGGLRMNYSFNLPVGLRCEMITEGCSKGKFFLDQFPFDIFPANSIQLHDATHYGIIIDAEDVDVGGK